MTTASSAERVLRDVAMGDAPVLETLAEMHIDTFERSGLDPKTYFLVRLAALVAMDAAPASYLLALATAEDAGVATEDVKGTLAAVAPVVGSARVVSAASHTLRALGLAELADEAAEQAERRK